MNTPMTEKKDHIWIIGASAGIGKALAIELANNGHAIALSARNDAALKTLCGKLPGNDHLTAPLDVCDRDTVAQAKDHILSRWQRIDRVVFMAGLYQPMRIEDIDMAQTKQILDVNLLGAFHVVSTILPHLLAHKNTQIALCASVAGYGGLPKGQPYGATKAGLINMTETLRAEHGDSLDVKLINPGFVESRLTDKNDFHMPMRITPEQAAQAIVKGLYSKKFEIHFPKRFTRMMRLISLLPYPLYFAIMKRIRE